MAEPVRLNKWIAAQGIASRRGADALIEAGRVRVNGETVTEMGRKVDPDRDTVEVDRDDLPPPVYVAVNKPVGYVSQVNPSPGEPKVVTQLVDLPGLFPVGRLDKDTSGLLLLTDDGTLTTALNHPQARKEKEYEVELAREIPDGALRHLEEGLPLFGTRTRPARVTRLAPNRFRIVLTEGRNRQVRRMCRKVGAHVTTLKRIRIDGLKLGTLEVGGWRHLTAEEVSALKSPTPPDRTG